MRASLLSLLALVLVLCGCNAAKSPLTTAAKENLTPVTTPTLYQYRPHSGTYRFTAKSTDATNGVTQSSTSLFRCDTTAVPDGLLWDIVITEVTEGGSRVAPKDPIAVIQARTDLSGQGAITSITSPWLDAMPGMEAKAKELLDDLRRKTGSSYFPPLSTGAVVSGQPLRVTPFGESDKLGLPPETTMTLMLDGEFAKDGTRYVMGSIDETYVGTIQGQKLRILIDGYGIMVKETMEAVHADIKVQVLSMQNDKLATVTMLMEKL